MDFFMLDAGTSTVSWRADLRVADAGEHIRDGIGYDP